LVGKGINILALNLIALKSNLRFLFLLFVLHSAACADGPAGEASELNTPQPAVRYEELTVSDGVAYYENEPFTGVAEMYSSGEVLLNEQEYLNGLKEGSWSVYHPNGKLQKKGLILNGKEHGEYKEWYSNGNLKYEYHYDQGLKTGKWLSWYEDGTRYTERNFENNQLNGKVLVWDTEGDLAKEYDYVRDRLVNSEMHFKKKQEKQGGL
jgi:antitoxin component YwqK of YwqJK toxin-antitoxin module